MQGTRQQTNMLAAGNTSVRSPARRLSPNLAAELPVVLQQQQECCRPAAALHCDTAPEGTAQQQRAHLHLHPQVQQPLAAQACLPALQPSLSLLHRRALLVQQAMLGSRGAAALLLQMQRLLLLQQQLHVPWQLQSLWVCWH
jgi:hypothetical protein